MKSRYSPKGRQAPFAASVERLESRRLLSAVAASTPFGGVPYVAGQTIEAENFDLGPEGVAYHNPGPANPANCSYRPTTTVGIQSGGSNGFNVGFTTAGEWLNYTVDVPAAGNYVLISRVASTASGGRFHATFDGATATSPIAIERTPKALSFHTDISSAVPLSAGVHVMQIDMDRLSSGLKYVGNFDTFSLIPTSATLTSFHWTPGPHSTINQFEGHGAIVDGKLYTFGGYFSVSPAPFASNQDYQVYNPATHKWTNLGNMPAPETHAGVAVDQSAGIIYFVGGLRGAYPGAASSDVYAYHTRTNTWTTLPSLPMPMSAGSAVLLDGQLHYMGGNIGEARSTDENLHLVLDLTALAAGGSATWQTAAPLPDIRDHASAVVLNNQIYLLGGEIGHDTLHQQQTACYRYDPLDDSWSRIADLPIPRSHSESSTFVYDGKIIIGGGQVDDFEVTNTVMEYDPATDRWTLLPSLPYALGGTILQPLGNQLFLTGGLGGTMGLASNLLRTGQLPASI